MLYYEDVSLFCAACAEQMLGDQLCMAWEGWRDLVVAQHGKREVAQRVVYMWKSSVLRSAFDSLRCEAQSDCSHNDVALSCNRSAITRPQDLLHSTPVHHRVTAIGNV